MTGLKSVYFQYALQYAYMLLYRLTLLIEDNLVSHFPASFRKNNLFCLSYSYSAHLAELLRRVAVYRQLKKCWRSIITECPQMNVQAAFK